MGWIGWLVGGKEQYKHKSEPRTAASKTGVHEEVLIVEGHHQTSVEITRITEGPSLKSRLIKIPIS